MKKQLILVLLFILVSLSACGQTEKPEDKPIPVPVVDQEPNITGLDKITIAEGNEIDYFLGVEAYDEEDGDLSASLAVSTVELDINTPGIYTITYQVIDSYGHVINQNRLVEVMAYELASGLYDLRHASYQTRADFIVAAEKWALENLSGGIPLFSSKATYAISDRVELKHRIPIQYGNVALWDYRLLEDDLSVNLPFDLESHAGKYTFRTVMDYGFYNMNLLVNYSENSALYSEGLYRIESSSSGEMSGYVFAMAADYPEAINPLVNENGLVESTKWRISMKNDLEWFFHEDTPLEFINTNPDKSIDARDIVESWKLALENEWHGIQHLTYEWMIKGAYEYRNGDLSSFNDVGVKAVQDENGDYLILELEFNEVTNINNLMSALQERTAPINIDLYNYISDNMMNEYYGSEPELTAYNGPYYVKELTDTYYHLSKNENYHSDLYTNITDWLLIVGLDRGLEYELFEDGLLDEAAISSIDLANLPSNVKRYSIPGSAIYKLNYNGLMTVENQLETFPDSEFVPEAILGSEDFRQAMFYALDRDYLSNDLLASTRYPRISYIHDQFYISPDYLVSYGNIKERVDMITDLYGDSNGYNTQKAIELFNSAITKLIEDGYYQAGTEENDTVIELDLNCYEGSDSWLTTCNYIKSTFEELFKSNDQHVKVQINVVEVGFPAIYYEYMNVGNFDLSVGGITVNCGCGYGVFESLMTMEIGTSIVNLGPDTDAVEIPVIYEYNGETVYELWSLEAIIESLHGETLVYEGVLADEILIEVTTLSPTSFEFEVQGLIDELHQNITYSIETYDATIDKYIPYKDYQSIEYNGEKTIIVSVDPGYGDYPINYIGDYIVKIEFNPFGSDDITWENESAWWIQASTVDDYSVEMNSTNGVISLDLHDNFNQVLVEAIPLDSNYLELAPNYVIEEGQIIIPNFEIENIFYIKLIYSDGTIDYLEISN